MSSEQRNIPSYQDRPLFITDDESTGIAPDDSETPQNRPSRPNSPSNQRRSFRCPIQADCDSALLLDKRHRHSVCLVDQSADGFRVSYAGDFTFKMGQVLRLRTLNGEYHVRVVYVEQTDDVTRIGLERLRDAAEPSGGRTGVFWFLIVVLTSAALFYWAG